MTGAGAGHLEVKVNGEARLVAAGATVEDVLLLLSTPRSGIAVALNGEIVHRGEWAGSVLAAGDRVEILTAAQGG